jgi:hypothetical protein
MLTRYQRGHRFSHARTSSPQCRFHLLAGHSRWSGPVDVVRNGTDVPLTRMAAL